jgi:hypothetical protein
MHEGECEILGLTCLLLNVCFGKLFAAICSNGEKTFIQKVLTLQRPEVTINTTCSDIKNLRILPHNTFLAFRRNLRTAKFFFRIKY